MSRPRFSRHFLWDMVQPRFLGMSCCDAVVVIAAVARTLFVPLMLELNHLPLSSAEAQRWDGKGYHHLKEAQTPLPGRIVALADATALQLFA